MKKSILLFSLFLLLSSCASVFNNPRVTVDVQTTKPTTLIYEQDTFFTENNKASFSLALDKENFFFTAQTDSVSKEIRLISELLPVFFYNEEWLTDEEKERANEYQTSIELDMSNTDSEYLIFGEPEVKNTYINFQIPYLASYLLAPVEGGGRESGVRYLGFGVGLDYFYEKNRFVNFSSSFVGGTSLNNKETVNKKIYSFSGYLTNNHRFRRGSFGYGLSLSENHWQDDVITLDDSNVSRITFLAKDTGNLGLVFNGYVQVTQQFYLGGVYRPTFFQLSPSFQAKYEHVVSVEFLWKFRWLR